MDFIVGAVKTWRAHFLDVDKKEAEVQGDIVFTATPDGAVEFLEPPSVSRTAQAKMLAPATNVVISATADADLRDGEGFRRMLTIMTDPADPINIVASEAVGGVVAPE